MGQKNFAVLTGDRTNEVCFFFFKKMYGRFARRPKKICLDNEVTVLPRWPSGGVRMYVQVCFRLLIRLFTTTTSFQHTVTTISIHKQISSSTTTWLHFYLPKYYFLLLHINFHDKQASLINKLQLLIYQFTSNITPRLPLHASQPTPKIYNATALLTHP